MAETKLKLPKPDKLSSYLHAKLGSKGFKQARFSRKQLTIYGLIFAAIGGTILYIALAAPQTKIWDTTAQFDGTGGIASTKSNVTTANDKVELVGTTSGGSLNPIWKITYETGGITGDPAEIGGMQYDSRGSASDMLAFSTNAREGSRSLQYTHHSGEWGGGSPSGETIEWVRPDVPYPTSNGCRASGCESYPKYPFNELDCLANPTPSARYRVGCPKGAYGEREGDETWTRFSMLPKTGFNAASTIPGISGSWFIIWQWHGNDDYSPPMAIDYRGGTLKMGGMAGQLRAWEGQYFDAGGRVSGSPNPANALNDIVAGTPSNRVDVPFTFQEEQWNDFMWHVKWTSYNTGMWELYHKTAGQNSWTLLGSKSNVPTMHRTAAATGAPNGRSIDNYLKGGIYQQPSSGVNSSGVSCYDLVAGSNPPRYVGNLVFHCGNGPTYSWLSDAVRQGKTRADVDETMASTGSSTTTTYPQSGSITLPYDATTGSHFSGFSHLDTKPAGTNITYEARTSCDQSSWSGWSSVDTVPDGRYLELRANLSTTNTAITPTIDRLSIDHDVVSNICTVSTLKNFAPNASFETDPTIDYFNFTPNTLTTFSWAADAAHTGAKALKIVSTQTASDTSRWLSQTTKIAAMPGRTYAATGWLKTVGATGSVNLSINFWNSAGTHIVTATSQAVLAATQDWTQLSAQAVAPAGTAFVRAEYRLIGPGTLWGDDLSITDGVTNNPSPTDTQVPSTPTNLTATAATSPTNVNLSWTASTDNVGVTSYEISRAIGSGSASVLTTTSGTASSYTDLTAQASTSYTYTLKAIDAANNKSAQSNAATVTTPPPPDITLPSTPTNLTATATSPTNVNLSWTASTDNVGVTAYKLYRAIGSGSLSLLTTLGNVTSYTDLSAAAKTTYSYQISAIDAAGNPSIPSTLVSITTPPVLDTTAPTVSISAPSDGAEVKGSNVNISAAASDNVSVASVQFYLDYKGDPNSDKLGPTATTSPYTYSWNTTTLGNGTHTLTAIATDTSNLFTTSSTITVTVNNPVVTPPVTTPPVTTPPTTTPPVTTPPTTTPPVTTPPATTPPSSTPAPSTPAATDTTAPSTPTGLQVSVSSSTTVSLNWNPSADNVGGVGLSGYLIYRNGDPIAIAATDQLSYTDSGLFPETAYSYTISAIDNVANESSKSSSVNTTTTKASSADNPPVPQPEAQTLAPANLSAKHGQGDISGDNRITVIDLSILLSHFNSRPIANTNGDVNGDGVVNVIDLSILLSNYGK